MSRGLSSIIVIIILLLITTSIGTMFLFWSGDQQRIIQNRTQEEVTKKTLDSRKTIRIENTIASSGVVIISNIGTANIAINEISVYFGGALMWPGAGFWKSSLIQPKNVSAYNASSPITLVSCAGQEVKVISPGTPEGDKFSC